MFKALVVRKDDAGYRADLERIDDRDLPAGEVLVDVQWSTINYKDGLAITGKAPVVRHFPLVPGIDFAGIVATSTSPDFSPGDKVILNGWGVGETHWGGLAQKARVKADWLIRLPPEFTTKQAMVIGTAGYTAMLCVMTLEDHDVKPDGSEILVTGATGGVGSVAISLLARRGYKVVASTGTPDEAYLSSLGAAEIMDRSLMSSPGKPLGKERWAGAVDTVGGHTLANICATMRYGGTVAACGMAQSIGFPASVAPFILRGVTLAGVDSVFCPKPRRLAAWKRLAQEMDPSSLDTMTTEIGLSDVLDVARSILDGKVRGRVVVDVNR